MCVPLRTRSQTQDFGTHFSPNNFIPDPALSKPRQRARRQRGAVPQRAGVRQVVQCCQLQSVRKRLSLSELHVGLLCCFAVLSRSVHMRVGSAFRWCVTLTKVLILAPARV